MRQRFSVPMSCESTCTRLYTLQPQQAPIESHLIMTFLPSLTCNQSTERFSSFAICCVVETCVCRNCFNSISCEKVGTCFILHRRIICSSGSTSIIRTEQLHKFVVHFLLSLYIRFNQKIQAQRMPRRKSKFIQVYWSKFDRMVRF